MPIENVYGKGLEITLKGFNVKKMEGGSVRYILISRDNESDISRSDIMEYNESEGDSYESKKENYRAHTKGDSMHNVSKTVTK